MYLLWFSLSKEQKDVHDRPQMTDLSFPYRCSLESHCAGAWHYPHICDVVTRWALRFTLLAAPMISISAATANCMPYLRWGFENKKQQTPSQQNPFPDLPNPHTHTNRYPPLICMTHTNTADYRRGTAARPWIVPVDPCHLTKRRSTARTALMNPSRSPFEPFITLQTHVFGDLHTQASKQP